MSKKVYFKVGNRLYTPREAKGMNIDTQKRSVKKVYRSIDEIMDDKWFGRFDGVIAGTTALISTKQLRNRKVAKQMTALGLLV